MAEARQTAEEIEEEELTRDFEKEAKRAKRAEEDLNFMRNIDFTTNLPVVCYIKTPKHFEPDHVSELLRLNLPSGVAPVSVEACMRDPTKGYTFKDNWDGTHCLTMRKAEHLQEIA